MVTFLNKDMRLPILEGGSSGSGRAGAAKCASGGRRMLFLDMAAYEELGSTPASVMPSWDIHRLQIAVGAS